jgi:tRNA uridine 5-carboxymethylaminomethyl modification enzyme
LGCVDKTRWDAFNRKRDATGRVVDRLRRLWVSARSVPEEDSSRLFDRPLERDYAAADLLKRPGVLMQDIRRWINPEEAAELSAELDAQVTEQVEIQVKYAGYIARQRDEVARQQSHETTRIPVDLDYEAVRGLSIEVRQKLQAQRPETVGQAARISGVTPAAISLLLVHLKRLGRAAGEGGRIAA